MGIWGKTVLGTVEEDSDAPPVAGGEVAEEAGDSTESDFRMDSKRGC